jgi:hypothetical protein
MPQSSGWKRNSNKKPVEAGGKLSLKLRLSFPSASAAFFLGSRFDPEDGSGMFLQKVGLSPNYYPEDRSVQPRYRVCCSLRG